MSGYYDTEPKTPEERARDALHHVLLRIRNDPYIGYYMGHCTESWRLCTEAYASLTGKTVDEVAAMFSPVEPRDPRKEALDDLGN